MMYHKDATEKKLSKVMSWAEKQELHDEKENATRRKAEKWHWPIDSVNILDIRQLGDDKLQHRSKGYTVDLVSGNSKAGFNKAGENMQNLKSSLMKIGMDVRQEKVVLEDDSKYDSKFRRPKEGSKPRLWSSRPEVANEKHLNVFHARSRDAGISASWTRFNQDEGVE